MSASNGFANEKFWGCIGTVLAALITGIFGLLIVFANKLAPESTQLPPTATATVTPSPTLTPIPTLAATPTETPLPQPVSYIMVHNRLIQPAQVWIGGEYRGDVESGANVEFSITSYPVNVEFEVVMQVREGGSPIGNDFRGEWSNVAKESQLTITNVVGNQYYFGPRVHNNLPVNCEIHINDGYPYAYYVGLVNSSKTAFAGYYYWYSNSNVTLYCGNDRKVYFWGIHPSYSGTTPLNVADGSGVLELTVNP